jgi:hypothetical protein
MQENQFQMNKVTSDICVKRQKMVRRIPMLRKNEETKSAAKFKQFTERNLKCFNNKVFCRYVFIQSEGWNFQQRL